MSILIADNLRVSTMTAHLNMIILKSEVAAIWIDIISGGGRDGLWTAMVGGAEKIYTESTANVIHEYAEANKLTVVPL